MPRSVDDRGLLEAIVVAEAMGTPRCSENRYSELVRRCQSPEFFALGLRLVATRSLPCGALSFIL